MENLFAVKYSFLIPLLPLLGAAISGFFGAKWLKGNSHWPIWIGVGCAAILSFSLLFGTIGERNSDHPSVVKNYFTWIQAGDATQTGMPGHPQTVLNNPAASFHVEAGFFFDSLTSIMLCVVTGIGFFITVFAKGYMAGEEGYFRFFAYLGLFIFSMTCLVMGENLVMLYLGWEGVGLCSYLLIGYYYEKPAAREAAKKAFLVNRVGDFGFGLGIMLSFFAFGTISYFGAGAGTHTGLLELAADRTQAGAWALPYIPFLLMVGAFGKSAQFPLYVWLPDAMEGPTPVSALIHAATMVTAGVYMIARCGSLFVGSSAAMLTIAIIGCFTALFAASIALRQFDLKKIFAYSTISQLGFMFVAVGVLAPVAGVFHLITHAFFKALLFLSSGVVMHAMAGELDLRKMSGLKRVLPVTRVLLLVGCLALAGFPPFSGFFSKDEIVGAAFRMNPILGILLLVAAFMTAYYTFRLYFRVFEGPLLVPAAPADAHGHGHEPHAGASASHSAVETHTTSASGVDSGQTHHAPAGHGHAGGHDDHAHNHEPLILIIPLIVLAIGAFFGGIFNFGDGLAHFLATSPSFQVAATVVKTAVPHVVPADQLASTLNAFGQEVEAGESSNMILMVLSGFISLAGITLAYVLHLKNRALGDSLASHLTPINYILEHKYFVDEFYQQFIVEPLRDLGKLFFAVDKFVIDKLIDLVSFVPQLSGFALKLTVQRGYLQGYAAAMILGLATILLLIFLR